MDYQVLFNVAIAVIAGLGGWVLNNITKSLDRFDSDIRAMPHQYVSRIDYKEDIAEIKAGLHRIYSKLDDKQDKHP